MRELEAKARGKPSIVVAINDSKSVSALQSIVTLIVRSIPAKYKLYGMRVTTVKQSDADNSAKCDQVLENLEAQLQLDGIKLKPVPLTYNGEEAASFIQLARPFVSLNC